jgi:serine/threonine protein kinase
MAFLIRTMSNLSRNGSSIVDVDNENTSILVGAKKNIQSKYNLKKEVIGKGSWGIVRKCQDRQTKQWFACKTISKTQVPCDETVILEQEVTNLERAKGHLHLVELVDVFEDHKDIHIVTELLTGGELYQQVVDLASRKPPQTFPIADAAWMIRNILEAIRYLHDVCHVVHRDLKASNFLFAKPNDPRSIKIIDFGLSRHAAPLPSDDGEIQQNCDSSLGMVTGCVGTAYYVAPEVLTHDTIGYTNKCDIWSVGVISYLILSGSLPFHGTDERETVKLLMAESVHPAFPDTRWKDVDPMAIDFCKSLLQKHPSNRPSARQAMYHPWLVKHCGEPPSTVHKEKHTRTEKTWDDESDAELPSIASCGGLTSSPSEEESLSVPRNNASSPELKALSSDKENGSEPLTTVPEDSIHGVRNILRKMITR